MDVGLVCDACSALTPIGVPQCKRCGAAAGPVTPRPDQKTPPRPPNAGGSGAPCTKGGTGAAPGNGFCPNCGIRVAQPVGFEGMETKVGPRPPVTDAAPPSAAKKLGRS